MVLKKLSFINIAHKFPGQQGVAKLKKRRETCTSHGRWERTFSELIQCKVSQVGGNRTKTGFVNIPSGWWWWLREECEGSCGRPWWSRILAAELNNGQSVDSWTPLIIKSVQVLTNLNSFPVYLVFSLLRALVDFQLKSTTKVNYQ